MPSSVDSIPRPYNLRVYLLGQAREGVFLRNVTCRKAPAPKKHQGNAPPDNRKHQQGERLCQGRVAGLVPLPLMERETAAPSTEPGGGATRVSGPASIQAGKRARTRLRRLVEANNLCLMFSLTFDTNEQAKVRTRDVAGDLSDWELARRYFARFRTRLKRWCKKRGLVYDLVAVAELQKRGVQHFHVATALPLRHADLLAMWGYGTVWISGGRAARRRNKRRPGSEASYVASYISKYMGKDMVQEPEEGPEQEPGQAGGGAVSGRGFHKSRYHRARSLKLPFEEHLLEPGDMSAFQEVLEQDGFQMSCEPFPIEKEGINFGWWARSVQMSIENGHLTHAPAPAEGGEDAGGGRPSHLKDGQVVTEPQIPTPNFPPEGAKHSQKSTGSVRRNSRAVHQRKQVAGMVASREPWGGGEEDA